MDKRIREDICGVEFTGVTGIVWICIKAPHAKIYQRHKPRGGENGLIFSEHGADRHHYVPKWPNREEQDGDEVRVQALQSGGRQQDKPKGHSRP